MDLGVFLCPAPEFLGALLQLPGHLRLQHPLGVGAVQLQQQVLEHCRGRGVRGARTPCPVPLSPPCPPWTARVVGSQCASVVRGWQTRPSGSTLGW